MPYIPVESRGTFVQSLRVPQSPGELNYLLTSICLWFLQEGRVTAENREHPTYWDYNDVIGALECCKLEMYRRAVAPHEDAAAQKNGDLPWPARS